MLLIIEKVNFILLYDPVEFRIFNTWKICIRCIISITLYEDYLQNNRIFIFANNFELNERLFFHLTF